MSETTSINTCLYNYVIANELNELNMNESVITVDLKTQHVKFITKDCNTSLTVFSITNTIRYIPYTINTLMGTIISMFGYQSELHRAMAVFVQTLLQSNIKDK